MLALGPVGQLALPHRSNFTSILDSPITILFSHQRTELEKKTKK